MKTTHSPLPWVYSEAFESIIHKSGELIASLEDCDEETRAANAQLIVHRVNTYDALVDALEIALGDLESKEPIHVKSRHTLSMATQQQLKEALALARNTEGTPTL